MSQNHQDQHSPTMTRFLVLAWMCLLATVAYIHRGCVSVPATLIQDDLYLDKDDMAQIMAAFFLGYTIFQLPGGWLADRFGTRRVLTWCVILWSAATGWMGLVNDSPGLWLMSGFLGMWLARLANGMAQAGIFPCCVKTISKWFPESGKAFPSGMLGSFMSVGAVIGAALTGFMLRFMSWEEVFLWLAVPGFACAAGFYWWFRDEPAEHSWVNAGELALIQSDQTRTTTAPGTPADSVWAILLGLPMLMVCTQQFFRAAAYIFFVTWYPTFLQETRGASVEVSGYLTSLTLMGVVIGCALGGIVMDWIYRVTGSKQLSRRGVAVFAMFGCGLGVCGAYFTTGALATAAILSASALCAALAAPAAYTITIDLGGRHVATVFSTMNMMGNLGATIMPLVVARLVDWYSWNEVLLLLASLYFIAGFCWTLVKVGGSQKKIEEEPPLSGSDGMQQSEPRP